MRADSGRVERIGDALKRAGVDAVVAALPINVLLLTGYCPVVGTSIAIATVDGHIALLVPEDERDLAAGGRANEIRLYEPGSLKHLQSPADAARRPLEKLLADLRLGAATVGYEQGEISQPAPYVGLHLYGSALPQLLRDAAPAAAWRIVDGLLAELRMAKTPPEIEAIQLACDVAQDAFKAVPATLRPGMTEAEASAALQVVLLSSRPELANAARLGGFMFCASGPNSFAACAAYQQSRGRVIQRGEPILLHCNSHVNGWWTDITRTYCLGEPTSQQSQVCSAIMEAMGAALQAIRPGARAAEVDRAARRVLEAHGFGSQFRHATGHGVGFAAIDHNARPRLHSMSSDVLQEGMVFNVEPGVYIEGFGGMRHCDMVAVTRTGACLLTSVHSRPEELFLPGQR